MNPANVIPMPQRLTLGAVKTASLYPAIKACLAEWSAGAAEMTDEPMARTIQSHVPANRLSPDAWLVHRAIGLGMRLLIGHDRHGEYCRLVEGIQLARPTLEVPGLVAKELLASGLLREMEEHDTRTHGGWRRSGIKANGCRVYALEI